MCKELSTGIERNMVNYYIPLQKHFSIQNSAGNMCLVKEKNIKLHKSG